MKENLYYVIYIAVSFAPLIFDNFFKKIEKYFSNLNLFIFIIILFSHLSYSEIYFGKSLMDGINLSIKMFAGLFIFIVPLIIYCFIKYRKKNIVFNYAKKSYFCMLAIFALSEINIFLTIYLGI